MMLQGPDPGRRFDMAVVGSGPAGLAVALALEAQGRSVLLLESGAREESTAAAALSAGHRVDEAVHVGADRAICRGFGGTSRWWGGRCVPFDPVDYARTDPDGRRLWPLDHAGMADFRRRAFAFVGIEGGGADRAPALVATGLDLSSREAWCPDKFLGGRYLAHVAASADIACWLGATVTDVTLDEACRRIRSLTVQADGAVHEVAVPCVVLACGGLETTRLLLHLRARHPGPLRFGGAALGRTYMGHLFGSIASIALHDPAAIELLDFNREGNHYIRQRLMLPEAVQRREGLLNTAFWLDNPPFSDPRHGSGLLSAVWMGMIIPPVGRRLVAEAIRLKHAGPAPYPVWRHAGNMLGDPLGTVRSISGVLYDHLAARPRRPYFLLRNTAGRYALHFHAEQEPRAQSRVSLSDRCDRLGVPFLDIDFSYSGRDVESAIRTHKCLAAALEGFARLDFHAPDDGLEALVRAQGQDGYHQLGTTRMGDDPAASVVDRDLKVHELDNLYLCASSVFPTSGQANPTFELMAYAIRLAEHLAASANGRG